MKQNDHLLSIEQFAARLGLRPVTVRQWAARRRVTRIKLGRRTLIPESEAERLIEVGTIPALPHGPVRLAAD